MRAYELALRACRLGLALDLDPEGAGLSEDDEQFKAACREALDAAEDQDAVRVYMKGIGFGFAYRLGSYP